MTLHAKLRLLLDIGNWIIPGRLLACSYPRRGRLERAIAASGITTVVNLHGRPHPSAFRERSGHRELHLPVPDFAPPSPAQLAAGVSAIRSALDAGERVAVHCGAGLGRTGTLVACSLVSTGLTTDAAIAEVRRRRPGSIETREQEAAVHAFATQKSSAPPSPFPLPSFPFPGTPDA